MFSQSVASVKREERGATVWDRGGSRALRLRPRLCFLEIPAIGLRPKLATYEKDFGWNIRHRESSHPSFTNGTG